MPRSTALVIPLTLSFFQLMGGQEVGASVHGGGRAAHDDGVAQDQEKLGRG